MGSELVSPAGATGRWSATDAETGRGKQVVAMVMLGIGIVAAIWLGIVWLSIAMHDDPGGLPGAFSVVTLGWLGWMVVAIVLLRSARVPPA